MLDPRQNRTFLVDDMDRIAARAEQTLDSDNSNRQFLTALLRATHYAAEHELTNRQRDCFVLRYEKNMKVQEIAEQLGINASTVSRHILAARKRIQKHARYSMFAFRQKL